MFPLTQIMLEIASRYGKLAFLTLKNIILYIFLFLPGKIHPNKVIHAIVIIKGKPQPKQKYIQLHMVFNRSHVYDFLTTDK